MARPKIKSKQKNILKTTPGVNLNLDGGVRITPTKIHKSGVSTKELFKVLNAAVRDGVFNENNTKEENDRK